jgi:membrane-associated protease RseP (regulator of RpoE activity)
VDLLQAVLSIVVFWVVVNLVYLLLKRMRSKETSVQLYYSIVLVVKRGYRGSPRGGGGLLAWVMVAIYACILVYSTYILILLVYAGLFMGAKSTVILVPGLNVTGLDLVYFILAVAIGVSLHEYLHAKIALKTGISVKSYGFLLALILPVAFVEVDEEAFTKARKVVKVAVLSAGVVVNLIIALVSTGIVMLLVSPTGFMIDDVQFGTPASRAGLQRGDIVYEINGSAATLDVLRSYMSRNESLTLKLSVYRPGVGFIEVLASKEPSERLLGVLVAPAPPKNLLGLLNPLVFISVVKAITWIYIVNYSLAFINTLPLFITDGGRIVREVAGRRIGDIVNYATLVALITALLFTARI